MAEAKAKAGALLLAFLVLTSCFVASSSSCIPRRLLLVSAYYRAPCNDERMDRPPKVRGSDGDGDGTAEATGSRIPKGPQPPTTYARAMAAPPGRNNN